MATLESCPKHNMVAYLEKTDGNTDFHEIIDFLTRSSIHYALTVSHVVSTTFVEQFWMSAKSKIINNVRYITAKVAGKPVTISEASIRSDLLFNDADGIDSMHNQAIFDVIQLIGYEGDLTVLTFNKALFSPQWRFLFHTMNHCIRSKSTSWDQIPTNIATAVICLATNQKYNFSKLIFDGMMRHLDAKKKFVMYPRFISVFLDKQLKNVPVPLDHFLINALTSKVFSFMVKKGKHYLGNVTPLFESMLVQPTADEGEASERQSEPQPTPSPPYLSADPYEIQPDPSPRPSPTIPDSIPKGSGGNHGGQSSSDRSLSGNEDGLTLQSVYDLCVSLCKQVTDQAKEIKHLKAQIKRLKKKVKPIITQHKPWMKSVSMKQRLEGKKSLKTKVDTKGDERQIKEMNEESKDPKKKRVVNETPREEDTAKVPAEQEVTEQDSEIMETKSFVSKLHKVSSPDGDYLVVYRVNRHFRAFNYLMEVLHIFGRQDLFHLYDLVMKQFSEITPEGIELILWGDLKIMMESSIEENDQVQKQTASGKNFSNLFIVDNLPEIVWFSTHLASQLSIHLVVYNEELAIPEQTATGKGISNLLMAGSLPKTTKPT
ncbi:hypothetical protein Tco_1026124 [Tanacetum coccineum]